MFVAGTTNRLRDQRRWALHMASPAIADLITPPGLMTAEIVS